MVESRMAIGLNSHGYFAFNYTYVYFLAFLFLFRMTHLTGFKPVIGHKLTLN